MDFRSRISVVVPVYNRASFLKEALESVFAQTLPPLEVIVIDDGSTDETRNLCQNQFPKIRYFYQENKGVSAARNLGVRNAQGEWFAFLDSDDLWDPRKIEVQWKYIENNPEVRIFQTEEIWIRNGRRVNPKKKHAKKSGWIFEDCIPLCIVSPSAVAIHREVFDKVGLFDEELPACEDYDLWLRVALHYPIETLSEALTIKRGGHADQLSKQWGLDQYRVRALQKLLKSNLPENKKKIVLEDIERRLAILRAGFEKRGKPFSFD